MAEQVTKPRRWIPAEQWLRDLAEQDTTTAARWGTQGKSSTPYATTEPRETQP